MHISMIKNVGEVSFPDFSGEKIYMQEFTKKIGLPSSLKKWQPTIDAMLDKVETDGLIYLMVDESIVTAGDMHRRGGVHVDNHWMPQINCHGGGHRGGGHINSSNLQESIIIASNVLGSVAYEGEYDFDINDDGDCGGLCVDSLKRVELRPNIAWAGNTATMLHESIPLQKNAQRTVVRLNVKGWTI